MTNRTIEILCKSGHHVEKKSSVSQEMDDNGVDKYI